MRDIVPLADLGQRLAEHGRIRIGEQVTFKSGKKGPSSIDHFRFTSTDEAALGQIAAKYGGEVRPWHEPKANPPHQFELHVPTNEIDVVLPPGALSNYYELWSGGGCQRRCDGVTCTIPGENEDQTVGCLCVRQGAMACKPKSRLNVLLPYVRFAGSWRLETSSWNALHELAATEDLIQTLQAAGDGSLLNAKLRVEQQKKVSNGKTKEYVVPRLVLDATPIEILSGQASFTAIPSATNAPALEAGPTNPHYADYTHDRYEPWPDGPGGDDIIDAEIVEDEPAPFLDDRIPQIMALPNAPAECPDGISDRQISGLLTGAAEWKHDGSGLVVKAGPRRVK